MRSKYNEKYWYKDNTYGRSNIFLKYGDYIEDLLSPTIDSYRKYTFEKLYVRHPLYGQLKKYRNKRNIDDFLYLTGLTGSGKTSLLKDVFKHYENTYVLENKMLVIPFACDNNVGEPDELKKKIASLFFGIIRILCEEYGLKKFGDNVEEFRKYIENRRTTFSVNQRGWKDISAETLLDQLYEDHPLELALLAFKYTMCQEDNPLENFIFIMDDIESVGSEKELFPIYLANKVRECLDNRSRKEKEKWCCTVIVACRRYVARMMRTKRIYKQEEDTLLMAAGINKNTLESFGGNEIDMGNGPLLKAIIEKREKTIEDSMQDDEIADFKEICTVLNSIVNQTGQLLLSLNVNDYRITLNELKNVICNRRWLQKFENSDGAFKIGTAEENFFRNKPNIIRAIAMGENDVYYGDRSIIPNLLTNNIEGGDLWKLLTMSIFVNDIGRSWNSSIDLEELKMKLSDIFSENESFINEINDSLIFLIMNRLLLRGKREEQRDSVDLRYIDAANAKYVYPSSSVRILWDNLSENSVLFELFVDDIWIENPYRTENDFGKKFIQFNLNNFKECVSYLDYLIDVEYDIRLYLKNRNITKEFSYLFGKKPITRQLYDGLWNSYNAYFKDKSSVDVHEQLRLANQLEDLDRKIDLCIKLFETT